MAEYEFIFVLNGISLDDDEAVDTLTTEFDALLSSLHGIPRMTVTGEGTDAVSTALSVAAHAMGRVDGLRFLRLDRDLVGVSDIAARTGRSRQNIDQWARGERRPAGPFPDPEGTVGTSYVWLWSDVNRWLRALDLDDGEQRPSRTEMNQIDLWLRGLPPASREPTNRTRERLRAMRRLRSLGSEASREYGERSRDIPDVSLGASLSTWGQA